MVLPNPLSPIVRPIITVVSGFELNYVSATNLSIFGGKAVDITGISYLVSNSQIDIDAGKVGEVNGTDFEALKNNEFYDIYAIGDSREYNPPGGLLSLSSAGNVRLPLGYDTAVRVGYVRTDGSANLLRFFQYGTAKKRTNYFEDSLSVASPPSASYVDLNFGTQPSPGGSIPKNFTGENFFVNLDVKFTTAAATDTLHFLTAESNSTGDGMVVWQPGVVGPARQSLRIPCSVVGNDVVCKYKNTGGSLLINVHGFEHEIV